MALRLRHAEHGWDLGFDDLLFLLASFITLVMAVQITWVIVEEGQGKHDDQVSKNKLTIIASSLIANETIWGVVNTLIRVSVLLFIGKIFGHSHAVQLFVNAFITLSVLYGLAILLQIFLICHPIEAAYITSIEGKCGNQEAAYLSFEVLGLVIDLVTLILPIPLLWRLCMSRKRKVSLIGLFSFGLVVTIITALRIGALKSVNSADFTYSEGYLGLLSILGALLSIITSCLPVVLPNFIRETRAACENRRYRQQGFIQVVNNEQLRLERDSTETRTTINQALPPGSQSETVEMKSIITWEPQPKSEDESVETQSTVIPVLPVEPADFV